MLPNPIDPGKLLGFRLVALLQSVDPVCSVQVGSAVGIKVGIKPPVRIDRPADRPEIAQAE
jgi:hypothetical protein